MASDYSGTHPLTEFVMSQSCIAPRRHVAALLAFGAAFIFTGSMARAEPPAGIHVTGVGEVEVVPDLARIGLEVRREGPDAAALKPELDTVTRAVLALARELGVADRDVTAAQVTIYPRYGNRESGEPVVDGVTASRTISITLRDLDRVGDLVNGALKRGVNGVGGIELDASRRKELERAALELAIADAVAKAEHVAAQFEVSLGPLVDASTTAPAWPRPMMGAMAMESRAASDFEPGQLTIRTEISASFAIATGD
jgi:uncharacterized protein YggE